MSKPKNRSAKRMGGTAKTPSNPLFEARTKLEEAERLRQARQFGQARKLCEAVLKHYPDYVGALHTLGLVHADKHEYTQALPHLVQAAMLNPRDWKTLTALAGVYLRLGAGAMAAWLELVETSEEAKKARLDTELRAYCELDTLAMVEIYRFLRDVAAGQ